MADKPTIFFSNTVGWATRNFFQTGVMEQLTRHFRVVVLASPAMAKGLKQLAFDRDVEIVEHKPGAEPASWRLFRQARKKLYTESRHSVTEATWEKYKARPLYQRLGGVAFKILTRIIPALTLYRVLEKIDYAINRDTSMRPLFDKYKPQFVFLTHATQYSDELIFRNARAAGVPSVYMILSWDHLATAKVLLPSTFDFILVWNDFSKQEIRRTYPHIPQERVRVVGIPQYDFYVEQPRETYAQWCARYGLDPNRRTILFSTMPQVRHEQQHVILEELARWVYAPEQASLALQILVKTHPFDSFPGYGEIKNRYPIGIHRTTLPPNVKSEDWIPDASEIQASRDCLYFCSININIFSTVTIEASLFDKPVIHIAFDPTPPVNRVPCREYYTWDHFKPIVDTGASRLVESYEQLFDAVKEAALHPEARRDQRRFLVQNYIGAKVGTAGDKLVEALLDFSHRLPQP